MGFPTGGTGTSAPLPTGAATAAKHKNIRLEPGDVLAVGLRTASSTATAELGIDWDED